jgi:hypothetical protein
MKGSLAPAVCGQSAILETRVNAGQLQRAAAACIVTEYGASKSLMEWIAGSGA